VQEQVLLRLLEQKLLLVLMHRQLPQQLHHMWFH
jgi:hypothetical protein